MNGWEELWKICELLTVNPQISKKNMYLLGTRLTWLTHITKHPAIVCMDSSSTEIWQSLSRTELLSDSQDSLPSGHVASTGLVANRTAKLGDIGRGSSLRISGSNSHNHISIDSHSNLNQHQIYGMKRIKLYRHQHSTIIINIYKHMILYINSHKHMILAKPW